MKTKSSAITRYAMIASLVAVGVLIDSLVTASAGIKAAIATLLVVLPFTQLFSIKESLFASLVFGLLSLVRAYVVPGVTSVAFMKIQVSVLPRLAIGVTAYFSYKLFGKLFVGAKSDFVRKYLASGISAGIGMLTNTVLVLTAINVGTDGNVIDGVVSAFITGYAIIELITSVLFVPVITYRLGKIFVHGTNGEV